MAQAPAAVATVPEFEQMHIGGYSNVELSEYAIRLSDRLYVENSFAMARMDLVTMARVANEKSAFATALKRIESGRGVHALVLFRLYEKKHGPAS